MKTLLVPTDYSETSKNAVLYALGFAKQAGANKIVLYHTYSTQLDISSDNVLPTGIVVDYAAEQQFAEEQLQLFRKSIESLIPKGIEIDILAVNMPFTSNINKVVKETGADAIVMGITGGGIVAEKLIGSNATTVARNATVPVIIVPPQTTYTHIIRILLASDFIDVELSTPFEPITKLLDATNAQLFILHVAKNEQQVLDAGHPASVAFEDWLPGAHPFFHFAQNANFAEAVNEYAIEKKIGLIIIIPKKHDLAETLFIGSYTKKLVFHTDIPVAAISNN
ncbi:universal stress protein [Parasediminibacterium sp. JCM 36343]|uniref:universal stress protein n=1 Tax=Parasediminibacterium sp. JCM 36343 TaxID=3374279 RepID=UPI00397A4B65